jgi:glycosyltransferase involved in cell wall biosynthesis
MKAIKPVWNFLRRGARGRYYEIFRPKKGLGKSSIRKISFLTTYINKNSQRYRVYNLIEELAEVGIECAVFKVDCTSSLENILDSDLLVALRVPLSENVMRILKEFRQRCIPIVFDIDDLVFEPESAGFLHQVAILNEEEKDKWKQDMKMLKATLLESDYVTCSTEALSRRVELLNKKSFVFPNTINRKQYELAQALKREKKRGAYEKIKIGYFSGTKTHEKDFLEVSDALYEILKNNSNVEFHLVGVMDIEEKFSEFVGRVVTHPRMHYLHMLKYLSQMDINLVPLEMKNIFTNGKSELKIFEAGLVSVPTVASPTDSYRMCIKDGVNGFLATSKREWIEKLERLIHDRSLRERVGEQAREDFTQRFFIKNRISDLIGIYVQIITDYKEKNKMKTVLYPIQPSYNDA